MVKNPPAMPETWAGSLGWGDPLRRRAWQPGPVFLPGESPWTEEPGGLQSMGSQTIRHAWGLSRSSKGKVSCLPAAGRATSRSSTISVVRMLRSRQLDKVLNPSCCFTVYKSRTMLIKPWVFKELFPSSFLKTNFQPSVNHGRIGMVAFSLQPRVIKQNTPPPHIILFWPSYFPAFDWILHFVPSFTVVLSTKIIYFYGLPSWLVSRESACSAGDASSIPGLGRSLGSEMIRQDNSFAWQIPRTEEPGWQQSIGPRKSQLSDWTITTPPSTSTTQHSWEKHQLPHFHLFSCNCDFLRVFAYSIVTEFFTQPT